MGLGFGTFSPNKNWGKDGVGHGEVVVGVGEVQYVFRDIMRLGRGKHVDGGFGCGLQMSGGGGEA